MSMQASTLDVNGYGRFMLERGLQLFHHDMGRGIHRVPRNAAGSGRPTSALPRQLPKTAGAAPHHRGPNSPQSAAVTSPASWALAIGDKGPDNALFSLHFATMECIPQDSCMP